MKVIMLPSTDNAATPNRRWGANGVTAIDADRAGGAEVQHIVRRGSTSSVRFRRAIMLLASADGRTVPAIARLVQTDEDPVSDVIHRFKRSDSHASTLSGAEAVPAC
ncbi:hypothetical protein [Streptomyces sp. NPDC002287]